MTYHGYTWEHLRYRPATDLKSGDTIIQPGMGTAFLVRGDGTVRGAGWAPLDGTAWTVVAREGDTTTCRRDDGREITADIPEGARVLLVAAQPTCTRCKRELRTWPLERGDRCAPKRWAYCIRPQKDA